MNKSTNTPVSSKELDKLITALEVRFVSLTQCSVSEGYALSLGGIQAPGIHYNLTGMGQLFIGAAAPIDVMPHTLIIVPPDALFRIEVYDKKKPGAGLKQVSGKLPHSINDTVRRFVAGEGKPALVLFCGYFHAGYGQSANIFEKLGAPIVEQFDKADKIDRILSVALDELLSQEIGFGAMSAALLKQVIITLLRRSLGSLDLWKERFSVLANPAISRAFAIMAANPSAPHTIVSLAKAAHLGRSAFMSQFSAVFGKPPIEILRGLRMRQANSQLQTGKQSVKEVAFNAGYKNYTSFIRAYRKIYGKIASNGDG